MTETTNYVQQAKALLGEKLPGESGDLLDLYTLLILTLGQNTTLEDVHDAWAVWRNNTNPNHKSLVPFRELAEDVRELDRKYMDAIRGVAKELLDTPSLFHKFMSLRRRND